MINRLAWEKIESIISGLGEGFFPFTSGNVSVKIDNLVYCTPSSIKKKDLNINLLSVIDLENNLVWGPKQTSEANLHLEIYKNFPKVKVVVHTHPFFCTIFAITGKKILTNILPEYYLKLRRIVYVKYVTPGTIQLAKEVVKKIKKELKNYSKGVVLLRNHGLVVFSENEKEAVELTLYAEEIAKINYFSLLIGKPNEIKKELIYELVKNYGGK
ncbi:MAG: class II aldolase/adducin family protein [bacterium]